MNAKRFLLVPLLIVSVAFAADPPPTSSHAPSEQTPATPQPDPVLALAPANALVVAYTAQGPELLTHATFKELFGGDRTLRTLLELRGGLFDNGVMVSFSGMPISPLTWRIDLAARVWVDRQEVFRRVEEEIIPAWARLAEGSPPPQFWSDGAFAHLQVLQPIPLLFTLGVRDGVLYASTRPGAVEAWTQGASTDDRFIDGDAYDQLVSGRSDPVGTLVYLDPRALLPMAATELNQTLPNLYEAFQLDHVEYTGIVNSQPVQAAPSTPEHKSGPKNQASRSKQNAAPNAQTDPIRVAVGLTSIDPGLWRLLASPPGPVSLARLFPADTLLMAHGSWEQGSQVVDDVRSFLSSIAADVVQEYEAERGEFAAEVGFDPERDFLGNLAGAWAIGFGGGVPPSEELVAFQLDSVANFVMHMHRLRVTYKLEIRPTTYRGQTIYHAARAVGPFAYAIVEDAVIASPKADTIRRAIDAVLDGTGLDRTERFQGVMRQTAPQTSKFVYFDFARFFADTAPPDEIEQFPRLAQLVDAGSAVGLSLFPRNRTLMLELATSAGDSVQVVDIISFSLMPSLARARYLSQRTVSLSNTKGILTTCLIYASEHEGRWPRSLNELLASGDLGDRAEAMQIMGDPYARKADPTAGPYYLYRHIADPKSVKDPANEVVISEPEIADEGGAVFGFLDGHVEWIPPPRAVELLAIMRGE